MTDPADNAEIERLETALWEMATRAGERDAEIERLRVEIERLRSALELIADGLPTMDGRSNINPKRFAAGVLERGE